MESSKVSIILPAYKAEKEIKNAIQSVLCQSHKNIELIVIENGPKDNTEAICNSFCLENTQKIIYVYTEIANVSNARNIGIEKATGDYIAFLDSDDKYENCFLEKMLDNLEKNKSEFVTCSYKMVNSKIVRKVKEIEKVQTTIKNKDYLEILKENYLFNELWNKLYISKIIKENNIKFNTKFELGEDFIFNLDYLQYVNSASYMNEPLYIYTDGQNGLKMKYRADKFEIEYALTKYLENYYKNNDYSLNYVYNRYARVYYNGILDIYKSNNPASKKEKNKQLSDFINTKKYKEDLLFLKNRITDKKFKIAVKYFFLKGKAAIKVFILLNNIRRK